MRSNKKSKRSTAEQAWLIRRKWFSRPNASTPTNFAEPAAEKGQTRSRADMASYGGEGGWARVNVGCCQAIGERKYEQQLAGVVCPALVMSSGTGRLLRLRRAVLQETRILHTHMPNFLVKKKRQKQFVD